MQQLWLLVTFWAMLGSSRASLSYTDVSISKSGYTGLVIAIHPEVTEDEQLIDAIKKTWTDASKDLYIATGNRAYFKEITILLPKTWDGYAGYGNVKGNENYDRADVVVAPPDESYGNEPYTIQYGECGSMGIRTHYTPNYLLNNGYVESYGPRGKVVVHEWAHYHWGVFDETSDDNPFYWENTPQAADYGPSPTTCTKGITGSIRNVQSGYQECTLRDIDQRTNSYPNYCVFFPDSTQPDYINSSVMAYQYLDNIITFCRDEDDIDANVNNIHNVDAPNGQNRLCSMRSTWSVIESSPDFLSWNTGDLTSINQTIPVFDVVIPWNDQRFVLVLDNSGSMDDSCGSVSRSDCLKTAAYQFITVTAPNDSYVGIVGFGTNAFIIANLTKLNTLESRQQLANSITGLNGNSGGMCIGCGIETGISVLGQYGQSAAGGQLIVITDGDENEYPYVDDVSNEVLQKGITTNTIFIATDANQDLKDLTEESGGQNYYAKTQSDLLEIFSQIDVEENSNDDRLQIHSASFVINTGSAFNSSVDIDITIGLDTIFTFTWSFDGNPPNIEIESPSGCYYSNYLLDDSYCAGGNDSYTVSASFRTIQFLIPGLAEVGKWIYYINGISDVGPMTSLVTSSSSGDMQPILVESGVGNTQVDSGAATVYAKITQGYNPMLGAAVTATIVGPGLVSVIDLYDNGAGSDIRQNDGIYSRYFTEFTGTGRYSVSINVVNGPPLGQSTSEVASRANYSPGYISEDGNVVVNPNGAISQDGSVNSGVQANAFGDFTRIVPSGSFDYSGTVNVNDMNAPDIYPPGKIIDARLRQKDLTDIKKGIVLVFTAPGDDYDSGTASGYELRYSFGNFSNLIKDFNDSIRLNQSGLTSGNLTQPLPAGGVEKFLIINLDLPTDGDRDPIPLTYFGLAIVAYDEVGNYAEPSNVPVLNIFIEPIVFPPPEEQDIWWIILISILLFVAIVAAVVYLWFRMRRANKKRGQNIDRQQPTPAPRGNNNISFVHYPSSDPYELASEANEGTQTIPRESTHFDGSERPPPIPRRDDTTVYQNTHIGQIRGYGSEPTVHIKTSYPGYGQNYPTGWQRSDGFIKSNGQQDTSARNTNIYDFNIGYDQDHTRHNGENMIGTQLSVVNEFKSRYHAQ